jgi:hypothetical protein
VFSQQTELKEHEHIRDTCRANGNKAGVRNKNVGEKAAASTGTHKHEDNAKASTERYSQN